MNNTHGEPDTIPLSEMEQAIADRVNGITYHGRPLPIATTRGGLIFLLRYDIEGFEPKRPKERQQINITGLLDFLAKRMGLGEDVIRLELVKLVPDLMQDAELTPTETRKKLWHLTFQTMRSK